MCIRDRMESVPGTRTALTQEEFFAQVNKIGLSDVYKRQVDNNSDDATKPTVSEFTTVNYIQ